MGGVAWTFSGPRVVITDGGSGIAAALSECWSESAVQRCLVHVQRNFRTYLTGRPRTEAAKALLRLGRALTRIHAPAEATEHQKRATEWYLYLHSEQPLPPAKLIETRHHRPPKTKATAHTEAYGTARAGQHGHDAPGIYTRFVL